MLFQCVRVGAEGKAHVHCLKRALPLHSLPLHVPRSPPMQPRYSIFRLFDDVLLLGKDGCVPSGPSMLAPWIWSLG